MQAREYRFVAEYDDQRRRHDIGESSDNDRDMMRGFLAKGGSRGTEHEHLLPSHLKRRRIDAGIEEDFLRLAAAESLREEDRKRSYR